jgi:hypothetical protein
MSSTKVFFSARKARHDPSASQRGERTSSTPGKGEEGRGKGECLLAAMVAMMATKLQIADCFLRRCLWGSEDLSAIQTLWLAMAGVDVECSRSSTCLVYTG